MGNKIGRAELKRGDHIYMWEKGPIYAHHGIYVGNGMVIHYTGRGVVKSSRLDSFLSGGHLYRFEYGVTKASFIAKRGGTCTTATSDPPEAVVQRAEYLLQKGFGNYSVFNNNCEDFAIYCKTGRVMLTRGRSGQVASYASAGLVGFASFTQLSIILPGILSGVIAIGSVALVGGGIFYLGFLSCSYCAGRLGCDIGVHPNVAKVPVERLRSVSA